VGSRAGSASAANGKRTNEGISIHQKLPDNNLGRRLVEVHQACEGYDIERTTPPINPSHHQDKPMNITTTELSTDELETIQAGRSGSTHLGYMPNPWVEQSDLISFYKDLSE
jgi:hypothetical protein